MIEQSILRAQKNEHFFGEEKAKEEEKREAERIREEQRKIGTREEKERYD